MWDLIIIKVFEMKKKIFLLILFLIIGVQGYSQPIQIYPPNNAYECPDSVLLDWADVPGAISYRVQVIKGVTTILDVSGILVSQYLIPSGILERNTSYYWRVQAMGPGGPGGWSQQWNFTLLGVPNPPILITPPNGAFISTNNVLFDWNSVPAATYYIFQLSKFPLFDSLIVNVSIPPPLPTINLQYNTLYYWRMKSGNICGTGNWSSAFTFTTIIAPPPTPVLICDTTNVPLTPTLDWNDVPTATAYRIQVSTSPAFSSTLINAIVSVSQYAVPSGILNYSTHYYWRVSAINAGGQGLYSSVCSFTTIGSSSIKIISSEVPTENKLYSNYPNPFNPTTKIKFDVTNVGSRLALNTTLKIYDILGKEIATLVNEKLNTGTYEVTFSFNQIPNNQMTSGIYFYKLETDGFSDVKRMVLIK